MSWLKTLHGNLVLYLEHSSLHGFNYFGPSKGRTWLERLLWIFIVAAFLVMSALIISSAADTWSSHQVSTTVDLVDFTRIPFPAVTICEETDIADKWEAIIYALYRLDPNGEKILSLFKRNVPLVESLYQLIDVKLALDQGQFFKEALAFSSICDYNRVKNDDDDNEVLWNLLDSFTKFHQQRGKISDESIIEFHTETIALFPDPMKKSFGV